MTNEPSILTYYRNDRVVSISVDGVHYTPAQIQQALSSQRWSALWKRSAKESCKGWKIERNDYSMAVEDAHKALDAAGVPSAEGARCDDPECQTKLGHRVRAVIAERDRLRQENGTLRTELDVALARVGGG